MLNQTMTTGQLPKGSTAALILTDGGVFWGRGIGAVGSAVGEVCFNTAITGYQEVLSDPSYAGQIITFTFPHIGNTGSNAEDIETLVPAVRGCVLRAAITQPSNFRATRHLDAWMRDHNLIGIAGVDTRRLTRRIREAGAPHGVIAHDPAGSFDVAAMQNQAAGWPGLEGMDLAKTVSCDAPYDWTEAGWALGQGYGQLKAGRRKVVAVDFGAKRNILRCLANLGCAVTVVPATTSAEDILSHAPDGVFLSNGPGDPAATGEYAIPAVQAMIRSGTPIFGICLGYQILALALGARTHKMHHGHHGANHPVQDLQTGKVKITSQNHGFVVDPDSLPSGIEMTHKSLFDGTMEGLRATDRPVFGVQHHPEASPGPQDSHYLFDRFMAMMDDHA